MKVFFSGSTKFAKEFEKERKAVYEAISAYGGKHVAKLVSSIDSEILSSQDHASRVKYFLETMEKLKMADVVVLEVSTHSLSMGFLINKALELNKMVMALHLPNDEPSFLVGVVDDRLVVLEYTLNTVGDVIKQAFADYEGLADTRFNFFVSQEIVRYLDWVHRNKKIPRAAFLRNLVEKAMKSDKNYNRK